jgi:hypothetical protein
MKYNQIITPHYGREERCTRGCGGGSGGGGGGGGNLRGRDHLEHPGVDGRII